MSVISPISSILARLDAPVEQVQQQPNVSAADLLPLAPLSIGAPADITPVISPALEERFGPELESIRAAGQPGLAEAQMGRGLNPSSTNVPLADFASTTPSLATVASLTEKNPLRAVEEERPGPQESPGRVSRLSIRIPETILETRQLALAAQERALDTPRARARLLQLFQPAAAQPPGQFVDTLA